MTVTYMQRGEALDYVNATESTIEAGTVVTIGSHIGIAGSDIAPGETGAIEVEGVFSFPLTDSTAVAQGTAVYWDGSGITATSGENTVAAGYAALAAAAGSETIAVKIG